MHYIGPYNHRGATYLALCSWHSMVLLCDPAWEQGLAIHYLYISHNK